MARCLKVLTPYSEELLKEMFPGVEVGQLPKPKLPCLDLSTYETRQHLLHMGIRDFCGTMTSCGIYPNQVSIWMRRTLHRDGQLALESLFTDGPLSNLPEMNEFHCWWIP